MRRSPQWQWHLMRSSSKSAATEALNPLASCPTHEGEVMKSYVTKKRDKSRGVLKFLRKAMKKGWQSACVRERTGVLLAGRDESHRE